MEKFIAHGSISGRRTLTDSEWFNSPYLQGKEFTRDQITEIERIGRWYDEQVSVVNTLTTMIWRELAIESYRQALRLLEKHNVYAEPVSGQPYTTHLEMFADIKQGILLISTENTEHPLLNEYDTFYLRVWHDMAHYEAQANFGYTGELQTYYKQCAHVDQYSELREYFIKYALYRDIVGQVCNGLIHKQFPIQKVF